MNTIFRILAELGNYMLFTLGIAGWIIGIGYFVHLFFVLSEHGRNVWAFVALALSIIILVFPIVFLEAIS